MEQISTHAFGKAAKQTVSVVPTRGKRDMTHLMKDQTVCVCEVCS